MDDIITVFNFLDERLLLSALPKYVADGADVIPSQSLYEGNLMTLMKLIGNISDKI